MDYTSNKNGRTLEFNFKGTFSFSDNEKIQKVIAEISDMEGDQCSIDLSGLDTIESAGLGMLLLMNDATVEKNKRLEISGATGQVHKMLEISKFSEIIPMRT